MSDRFIAEFYEGDSEESLAAVLSLHGGDNPGAASLTLAAFLSEAGYERSATVPSAGEVAAEFIIWSEERAFQSGSCFHPDTMLVQSSEKYPYQLMRLRVRDAGVMVTIITDEYTTEQEIDEAEAWLLRARVPYDVQ